MTKYITTETVINTELSAQDIINISKYLGIIPNDWEFYSVEIKGNGISNGANIIVTQTTKTKIP